jgi:3-hydroxyisobutyrate dehydrogenase
MEIGFIGTGLMGLPMAARVITAGLPLSVYNRTAQKLAPLQALGATIAPTPEALIARSNCIVLMLTHAQAIRETLLSPAGSAYLAGKTVIQMGTIAPAESIALQTDIIAAGGDYLEAPVLGSIPEAIAGTLLVMVGSTPSQFDHWLTVLQCFGADPVHVGSVGTAAALKLALNQLISGLTTAFATSLGFVTQHDIPVETFMQILRNSALYAPTFDKKLQRMVEGNYANPNFPTKHLLKDVRLFTTAAAAIELDASTVTAAQSILERAIRLGLAESDYSALFAAITHPADP